jgi:hypothetical protein
MRRGFVIFEGLRGFSHRPFDPSAAADDAFDVDIERHQFVDASGRGLAEKSSQS